MPVERQRLAHPVGLVSDDGEDVLRGNDFAAAAATTCASSGFPAISCSTLGRRDFSRVPLPAARIAMANVPGFVFGGFGGLELALPFRFRE